MVNKIDSSNVNPLKDANNQNNQVNFKNVQIVNQENIDKPVKTLNQTVAGNVELIADAGGFASRENVRKLVDQRITEKSDNKVTGLSKLLAYYDITKGEGNRLFKVAYDTLKNSTNNPKLQTLNDLLTPGERDSILKSQTGFGVTNARLEKDPNIYVDVPNTVKNPEALGEQYGVFAKKNIKGDVYFKVPDTKEGGIIAASIQQDLIQLGFGLKEEQIRGESAEFKKGYNEVNRNGFTASVVNVLMLFGGALASRSSSGRRLSSGNRTTTSRVGRNTFEEQAYQRLARSRVKFGRGLQMNSGTNFPRPNPKQSYRATFNVNGEPYVFRSGAPKVYVPKKGGLGIEFPSPLTIPTSVEKNPLSSSRKNVGFKTVRSQQVQFERFLRSQGFDEVKYSNITRAGGGDNVGLGRRGDIIHDLGRYDK